MGRSPVSADNACIASKTIGLLSQKELAQDRWNWHQSM